MIPYTIGCIIQRGYVKNMYYIERLLYHNISIEFDARIEEVPLCPMDPLSCSRRVSLRPQIKAVLLSVPLMVDIETQRLPALQMAI
jgi:hypothetical protein